MGSDFGLRSRPFTVDDKSLSQLLDLGTYELRVPEYQRPYEWTERCVADLLSDILNTYKKEGAERYLLLGNILLYKTFREESDKTHDVVDGQQRLSTLVLLYSVIFNRSRTLAVSRTETSQAAATEQKHLDLQKRFKVGGGKSVLSVVNPEGGDEVSPDEQLRSSWTTLTAFHDVLTPVRKGGNKYAMRWSDINAWAGTNFKTDIELWGLLEHLDKNACLSVTIISNSRMGLALKSFVRCNTAGIHQA